MNRENGSIKFYKDNRGDALAMVIIVVAFVTVLASVLMFVSYSGYKMRQLDRRGKDTFYDAETVLDEINVGLQREASEVLQASYEDIMENYAVYSSANARNIAFRNEYFTEMKKALEDGTTDGHYNIETLRGYLSEASLGGGTLADGTDVAGDGTRRKFLDDGVTYGAIVESNVDYTAPEGTGETALPAGDPRYKLRLADAANPENNTRIVLEDLKVSYIDPSGYVSIISTDISIGLPAFNFAQAASLPKLETCSLIANHGLVLGDSLGTVGQIEILGDVYAGTNPDDAEAPSLRVGSDTFPVNVKFDRADGLVDEEQSLLVSQGDIGVAPGSRMNTERMELWAQNLVLDSAEADLSGSTNLKNDLILDGTGSSVTLAGDYTGFGYIGEVDGGTGGAGGSGGSGGEGTGGTGGAGSGGAGGTGDGDGTADTSSNISSAIIINGRDSRLDLSGLTSLTISGRAYVSTGDGASTSYTAADGTAQTIENKQDVMMGESLAVKSNQMIYLAPASAVGCRVNPDGTIGDSEYNCNPLTLAQYESMAGNPGYCMLDGTKAIPELGNRSLGDYIDQENTSTGPAYVPQVVFQQTNAGPIVYCYLRFRDEDAANRYFADYYGINADQVDRYLRLYAQEIRMGDDMVYLNTAGNMLVYDAAGSVDVVDTLDSNLPEAKRTAILKDNIYNALTTKMIKSSGQITGLEQSRDVFSNIIDEAELLSIIAVKNAGSRVQLDTADGAYSMVLTREPTYTIDSAVASSSVRIVVSTGDIVVKSDFTGLIIAKGTITVEDGAGITVKPIDAEIFSDILYTKVDEFSTDRDYYLLNVFNDSVGFASSGTSAVDAGTSKVSMADLITYERWLKK